MRRQFKSVSKRDASLKTAPAPKYNDGDEVSNGSDDEMNARYKFKGVVSDRKQLRKQKREEKKQRNKEFYLKKYHVEEKKENPRPLKKQRLANGDGKSTKSEINSGDRLKKRTDQPAEEMVDERPQPKSKKATLTQLLVERGLVSAAPAVSQEDEEKDQRIIKQMERKLFLNRKKNKAVGGGLDSTRRSRPVFVKRFEDSEDEDEFAQLKYVKDDDSEVAEDLAAPLESPPNFEDDPDSAEASEREGKDNIVDGSDDEEDDDIDADGEVDGSSPTGDESSGGAESDGFGDEDVSDDADESQDDSRSGNDVKESHDSAAPSRETQVGKYVPPHLRNSASPSSEADVQLRREVRGQVNRLAEATLRSILQWCTTSAKTRGRSKIVEILSDELLNNCSDERMEVTQLMTVYASVVAFLHGSIGLEVGGSFLEALARRFLSFYHEGKAVPARNLINLLCNLYNFKIVHHSLVYDLVSVLITRFDELSVDLLLVLIRTVGPQLRADDPSALKKIVLEVFDAAKKAGVDTSKFKGGDNTRPNATEVSTESPFGKRMEFMVETILSLKNNKLKALETPATLSLVRLKKQILKDLKDLHRVESLEIIRISWADLVDPSVRGRYWMVGSAFAAPSSREQQAKKEGVLAIERDPVSDEMLKLARLHRMNTDVKRALFVIMLNSEDYLDAYEKIVRLQLKSQQERDIVSVLVYCMAQEKEFNPFYGHLASKLCLDISSLKFTFKIVIWDHLKGVAQGEEKALKANEKMAQLLAQLLMDGSLPATVFKPLEVETMDKATEAFFERAIVALLGAASTIVRQYFTSVATITQSKDRDSIISQLSRFLKILAKKIDKGDPSKYSYTGATKEHLLDAAQMSRQLLKNAKPSRPEF